MRSAGRRSGRLRRAAGVLGAAVLATGLAGSVAAGPAPGDLDPSFNADGKSIVVAPDDRELANAANRITIDEQDRVLVAGFIHTSGTFEDDAFLARFTTEGELDLSFSGDGMIILDFGRDERFNDVEVDDLGRIVAAGSAHEDALLARFAADGTPDPTFGDQGILLSRFGLDAAGVSALEILSPAHYIVAGSLYEDTGPNAISFSGVVRLNTDGSVDPTFGTNGISERLPREVAFRDLALDRRDGLVVGANVSGSGDYDMFIVRYDRDGAIDRGFARNGRRRVDFAGQGDLLSEVGVDSRGRIVASGYAAVGFPASDDMGVVRLTPTGAFDDSFSSDGKASVDMGTQSEDGHGHAIDRNDEIVVVGSSPGSGNERKPPEFAVARLTQRGRLDKTFSGDGYTRTDLGGADDGARDVAIDSEGRIVVAGRAGEREHAGYGYYGDLGIARYAGGPYGRTPSLSINDVSKWEGDWGYRTAYFKVALSDPASTPVSVRVRGEWYPRDPNINRVRRWLHFEPGETQKRVPVKVFGDLRRNEDDRYRFRLSLASGAYVGDGLGMLRIRDDKDPCDIVGTSGDDRLVGTRGVTCGLKGNDYIDGGHHFDKIVGGRGHDRIFGNEGNDRLLGGPGRDRLYGGNGSDSFHGGRGWDRCPDDAWWERTRSCS